jgi:YceI-like protein
MKLGRLAKILAIAAAVFVIGGVGAYAWMLNSRPPSLGLITTPISHTPAPSPLTSDPLAEACKRPAAPAGGTGPGAGLWVIQPASVAGYRAHEKFADLPSPHEAVARTDRLSGWLQVADDGGGAKIVSGCVAVELSSLMSVDRLPGFNTADRDSSARDFLHVGSHPYAVFRPDAGAVSSSIATGVTVHVQVPGGLELSGTTKSAKFALRVRFTGGQLAAAGATTVNVGDYGIEVPTTVGEFVAVDPRITLEVSLVLLKA